MQRRVKNAVRHRIEPEMGIPVIAAPQMRVVEQQKSGIAKRKR
jgi:hypothetical protein